MSSADDELWKAWAAGDKKAGEALVKRYHSRVDRFFRFKVGADRGVDLTQATFLTAQECLHRFRGESSFATWLFAIARNKLLDYLRSDRRTRQRFDPDASSIADFDPTPSACLGLKQQNRLLLAALRRLSLDDQVMLELHYWEGMKIEEIAGVVEKPSNTVKTRMRRARLRLEELMNELAESQEELETTRSGLERWAARVRAPRLPSSY